MPWPYLLFGNDTEETPGRKYKAQGIPYLVIVDENGEVITKDDVDGFCSDQSGEHYPWKPKIDENVEVITKDGVDGVVLPP
eukprot:15332430-Ditylum_brightwellii.AAC.1